jgi:hypothetical protein
MVILRKSVCEKGWRNQEQLEKKDSAQRIGDFPKVCVCVEWC